MSKKKSLTRQISISMLLGLMVDLLIHHIEIPTWLQQWLVSGLFELGGRIFMALLKLLVVPLVFISLVVGTASLEDVHKLGRIGIKTFSLYLITTAVAVALAIALTVAIRPGEGLQLQTSQKYQTQPAPPVMDTLVNIIPENPVKALAQGEMLQIIFFAIFLGITLASSKNHFEKTLALFKELDGLMMKMVLMIIQLAPYGVFFLMAKVFATQGFSAILPLGKYFFTVLLGLAIHLIVFYSLILNLLSQLNPLQFFRKFKGVMLFAFSTSSSNATIPVTLENVTAKLGVPHSIGSFTIPLGATINMDGTAIMQGAATVFIAQVYGIDIGLQGYLTVILMATLASVGTAGVPGVGLITLAMVLSQVNLPTEGIALIMGVDRFLDMARTVVNVSGDAVVTCIVAKSEKLLDLKTYNSSPDIKEAEWV